MLLVGLHARKARSNENHSHLGIMQDSCQLAKLRQVITVLIRIYGIVLSYNYMTWLPPVFITFSYMPFKAPDSHFKSF
jgi:hypothetical protein